MRRFDFFSFLCARGSPLHTFQGAAFFLQLVYNLLTKQSSFVHSVLLPGSSQHTRALCVALSPLVFYPLAFLFLCRAMWWIVKRVQLELVNDLLYRDLCQIMSTAANWSVRSDNWFLVSLSKLNKHKGTETQALCKRCHAAWYLANRSALMPCGFRKWWIYQW